MFKGLKNTIKIFNDNRFNSQVKSIRNFKRRNV